MTNLINALGQRSLDVMKLALQKDRGAMQKEFAAFIGIDWADRKHDV